MSNNNQDLVNKVGQVDYNVLDNVKGRFIKAAQSTLEFACEFGSVPQSGLGASANVFNLNLNQFLLLGGEELKLTLISEGLGTADDARPDDLTEQEEIDFWYNIGFKTVSCLTNDAASAGLQSLLISLYLPTSTPETVFKDSFLKGFTLGVTEACKIVGCVYISGETPQLKSKILPDKIDIAGSVLAVGLPGRSAVDGQTLSAGDKIVFVASSGPHENGFTPLREMATRLKDGFRTKLPNGLELYKAMNAASVLYTPLIRKLLESEIVPSGIENISGHGWQKIMRNKLPLTYQINEVLPFTDFFKFVEEQLGLNRKEMCEIFNCGVGLVIFVKSQKEAQATIELAANLGLEAIIAGDVKSSNTREVLVEPWGIKLSGDNFALSK